jgi:peptide/nickel transport system ATP-binding protein
MPGERILLEARKLTKIYPHARGAVAVDNLSFTIARGETLGLVGESGSGKSTVARLVLRLLEPTSGEVFFDGQKLQQATREQMRKLRRRMQIVFQDPYAALNPRMRVCDIVAEPLIIHEEASTKSARHERVRELLRQVGLDESAMQRYPHEFSGGQRQRINIARALALRPEFVVLDEPVSALDVSVGAQVINLLQALQRELGLTYLFISHSMPLVRYLSTRIAVMQHGRLVEIGDALAVCEHPRQDYTRQLIAATPKIPAAN